MDVQLIVLTRMASQQSSSDTVEPRHTMASIRAIEATHQKELERLNTTILSKRQRLTQRIEQDHMVQQKQLEEDLGALEQDMTDISDAWHEEKEKLEDVNKALQPQLGESVKLHAKTVQDGELEQGEIVNQLLNKIDLLWEERIDLQFQLIGAKIHVDSLAGQGDGPNILANSILERSLAELKDKCKQTRKSNEEEETQLHRALFTSQIASRFPIFF